MLTPYRYIGFYHVVITFDFLKIFFVADVRTRSLDRLWCEHTGRRLSYHL